MAKLGRILRIKQITPDMVRGMPGTLFVFDDNMQRISPSSQAAALREQSNIIGLPTRWHPGSDRSAFFSDDDWQSNRIFQTISDAFDRIERALSEGRNVVLPTNGFGTGYAELSLHAPMIHAFVSTRILELEADYSC